MNLRLRATNLFFIPNYYYYYYLIYIIFNLWESSNCPNPRLKKESSWPGLNAGIFDWINMGWDDKWKEANRDDHDIVLII